MPDIAAELFLAGDLHVDVGQQMKANAKENSTFRNGNMRLALRMWG